MEELEKIIAEKDEEIKRLREKLNKAYQKLDEIIGDYRGLNEQSEKRRSG